MADLMARLPGPTEERGHRGQILLVAALVLGVSFVALAIILNSAIFTENLASRGDTTGADEVVTYQSTLDRGVSTILAYETTNSSTGETHSTVLGRIETGVSDANTILVRRNARRGAIANVTIVDHTEGSRVFQDNASRNFTDDNTVRNWTVASGIDRTRAFRLNLTRSGLPTGCTLLTDCYTVNVTDGSDLWQMSVAETASGVEVRVDDGGTTASCSPVAEPHVTIDLTAGTVGGEPCSALSPADWPAPPYDIEYGYGEKAVGTYTLVVDDPGIANSPPGHLSGSGDPSESAAIYDLTVAYDYQTSAIFVGHEIRIAPGEPDG